MAKAEPIATKTIDKRITEGRCSLCGEPLELGNDVGSPTEQYMKLNAAFGKHMDTKHRREDTSQAAARTAREAAQQKLRKRSLPGEASRDS